MDVFFLQADGIYDDPLELLDIRPELSDDEALNDKVIDKYVPIAQKNLFETKFLGGRYLSLRVAPVLQRLRVTGASWTADLSVKWSYPEGVSWKEHKVSQG